MPKGVSIFIFIMLWLMVPLDSVFAYTYSGGTGEPDKPYLIATAEDMNEIGAHPDDWDKHFLLIADINLAGYSGKQFNIIGNYGNDFTGVFDGNNNTIYNYKYRSTGQNRPGLFAYIRSSSAEIKNLGLIEPDIHCNENNVGSLVGRNSGGQIKNCYVIGGNISGKSIVGGLVGISTGHISNCYFSGSVSGSANNDTAAGLVGWNIGTVSNCYSTGNVEGRNGAGGLVSFNFGVISNCYSNMDVSGLQVVGGLVGQSTGTIHACYSTGKVTGNVGVGGLLGNDVNGKISACLWDMQTSACATSDGGRGKTTAEMKARSTFAGWGCEMAWTIDDNNDYPRLAWENKPGEVITNLSYGGGTGTPSDPYLIYTAEQLDWIGLTKCDWNKHFKLMANIDFSSFEETDFSVIGYGERNYFAGVFDGNGHTISNFNCLSGNGIDYKGLFGYVYSPNAEVRDVGLIDPNVGTGAQRYVGALVGYLQNGTVRGCYAKGGSIYGDSYVGGLVGYNKYGDILNCHFSGRVIGTSQHTYAGGLVGRNYGYGKITNCYAVGSVYGLRYVGGLAGVNSGDISNCYFKGDVVGTIEAVGGISGIGSNIDNCYFEGSVAGSGDYVGGLSGRGLYISKCYSSGSIEGGDEVGGLVGYGGYISNCYSRGSVKGNNNVGGLLGTNEQGTVSKSYASIEIEGVGNYTGGLVGYHIDGSYFSCFWNSDINPSLTGIGNGSDTNVISGSTANMQTKSTFINAGWDFVGETANGTYDIWDICEGTNYPKLVWQIPLSDFLCPDGVNFVDYSYFAEYWLHTNCAGSNNCHRTDINFSGTVDMADLEIFCQQWLQSTQ
ncbi:MAG: GLUG motif-containing protein [Planctomycetota bacterium]